jgi:hypothetical protein
MELKGSKLIQQHGVRAGIEATHQARKLARGDRDGRRAWLRVRQAIKTLQARPKGRPN